MQILANAAAQRKFLACRRMRNTQGALFAVWQLLAPGSSRTFGQSMFRHAHKALEVAMAGSTEMGAAKAGRRQKCEAAYNFDRPKVHGHGAAEAALEFKEIGAVPTANTN